jgi:hypothetical protein
VPDTNSFGAEGLLPLLNRNARLKLTLWASLVFPLLGLLFISSQNLRKSEQNVGKKCQWVANVGTSRSMRTDEVNLDW